MHTQGLPSSNVSSDMPAHAKESLSYSMHGGMLSKTPLFAGCSRDFVAKLCSQLVRQVVADAFPHAHALLLGCAQLLLPMHNCMSDPPSLRL